MRVKINGRTMELAEPLSVSRLLAVEGIQAGEVVVQYNGEIIDRSAWLEVVLQEGDELEILRFVGGG